MREEEEERENSEEREGTRVFSDADVEGIREKEKDPDEEDEKGRSLSRLAVTLQKVRELTVEKRYRIRERPLWKGRE